MLLLEEAVDHLTNCLTLSPSFVLEWNNLAGFVRAICKEI